MGRESHDLYTLDILNQAQGPFRDEEIHSLAGEHTEVLVYDPASGDWLPIDAFGPKGARSDPDRALAGRTSDAREGELSPRQRIARAVEEILGVCRGLVADGVLNEREATFLDQWCKANPEIREQWPVADLVDRIRAAFVDGVLAENERRDLERVLRKITGATPSPREALRSVGRLPVDLPEPDVRFSGLRFAVAGEFVFGERDRVARAITERGGVVQAAADLDTNYVVVGSIGVGEWRRAPWGAEVQRAVRLREQGAKLAIVGEDHWARHLRRP